MSRLRLVILSCAALLAASACELFDDARTREDIDGPTAVRMINERAGDPNFVILDVRTPAEFAPEHLRGAVNMDYTSNFRARLDGMDKIKAYLVYCLAGGRSGSAADTMQDKGFREVYNLAGGIAALRRAEGGPELIVSGD